MTDHTAGPTAVSTDTLVDALYRDGMVGLPAAFPRRWAADLMADYETLYADAERRDLSRANGAGRGRIPRGPGGDHARRFYFAVHLERVRGFRELVTHPVLDALFRDVLGEDYQYVEIGFDVAFPGAVRQPLHRDFPTPEETLATGRFSSLALNATCVDVTPEMGPLEIVPGSHFDDGSGLEQGMRVPVEWQERYEPRVERRMPKAGDVSVRSGLAIHRGTANVSERPRPVLILGVMDGRYQTFAEHEFTMTRAYHATLPDDVRAHLARCRVVDDLDPIAQDYVLDFLLEEG